MDSAKRRGLRLRSSSTTRAPAIPTFDPFEAAEKGFAYLDCVTF